MPGSRTSICEFCHEPPPEPYIYCQRDDCRQLSLARIVAEVRQIKASQLVDDYTAPPVQLVTQAQAICPLCREMLSSRAKSSCGNCKTTYHNDCLLELTRSRCSTFGCGKLIGISAAI